MSAPENKPSGERNLWGFVGVLKVWGDKYGEVPRREVFHYLVCVSIRGFVASD